MAAGKIAEDELLEKIGEIFRLYGYEGASIRLIAEAAGLERASLYHRFPGGKEEMAGAIVARTGAWLEAKVFAPLRANGTPREKVRRVAVNLKAFYRRGTLWCVMDSMTLGGGPEPVRRGIRGAYAAWVDSFAAIARENGASPATARARAEQALVEIEGSLVIARLLGENKAFLRVIEDLPDRLLGEEHPRE